MIEECRGHELRLAEGAGPGRRHVRGVVFLQLHHLQRSDQLRPGVIGARAVIGERRQRLEHIEAAHGAAIIGFVSPDRNQDFLRHAVFGFDGRQDRAVAYQQRAAVGNALRRYGGVEIAPHRIGEFGLVEVEVGDALQARCLAERGVIGLSRNAGGQRRAAEIVDELDEGLVVGRGRSGGRGGDWQCVSRRQKYEREQIGQK